MKEQPEGELARGPAPPSARTCFAEGLRACLRHPFAAWVGMPLAVGAAVGGCLLPWVGLPFLLLAAAQTLAAVPHLAVRMLGSEPIRPSVLLDGFRSYQRWLGLAWVGYLVTVAVASPLAVAAWFLVTFQPEPPVSGWLLGLSAALCAGLWIAVFHRFAFAPSLAVDALEDVPMQAILDASSRRVGEHRGPTLRTLAVLAICAFPIVTLPVVVCAVGFLALRSGGDHGAEESFEAV